MITVDTAIELKGYVGQRVKLERPFLATAGQLKLFLDVSGDRQAIHDPKKEEQTILPANFILTLIPACLQQLIKVNSTTQVMTVGYQSVMFRQPVHLSEPMDLGCSISKVVARKQRVFVYCDVEIRSTNTNKVAVTLRVTDCYECQL